MKFLALALAFTLIATAACTTENAKEPTPSPSPTAAPASSPTVIVSIDGPTEVDAGSEFTVTVSVTRVTDLAFSVFDLTYDPAVIQVGGEQGSSPGVSNGAIGDTPVSVEWAFLPSGEQGKLRVLGEPPDITGVTGSGYLAKIHFAVVAAGPGTTDLTLSEVMLTDAAASEITPVSLESGSVHVAQ